MSDPVIRAVNRLLYAGMVLRYRSKWGHSFYLGWPGRSGVLRVSDHVTKTRYEGDTHIKASITLHSACTPESEDKFTTMIAEALGRYLLKTEDT